MEAAGVGKGTAMSKPTWIDQHDSRPYALSRPTLSDRIQSFVDGILSTFTGLFR